MFDLQKVQLDIFSKRFDVSLYFIRLKTLSNSSEVNNDEDDDFEKHKMQFDKILNWVPLNSDKGETDLGFCETGTIRSKSHKT